MAMAHFLLLLAFLGGTLSTSLIAAELPVVELSTARIVPIQQEVRLNGTVNTLRSASLSSAVPGLIISVKAQVGNRIESGNELFSLDSELERFGLESEAAAVKQAQAAVDEAERRVKEARSVGAGRSIAQTELSLRESILKTVTAELARLSAQRDRQRALVARHSVKAPFSGVITARTAELGEWVEPGNSLVTLVDDNNLRLDFQVPQSYYAKMQGNKTTLQLSTPDGKPSQRMPAEIVTMVPFIDPQARTFLIRAVPPAESSVLPGMAIEATLIVDSGRTGIAVPRDAVNRYADGRTIVWVATDIASDGRDDEFIVSERRIQTGADFGDRVIALDGLSEGELVVSRGNESLNENMKVQRAQGEAR